jgi:hypothetical protein
MTDMLIGGKRPEDIIKARLEDLARQKEKTLPPVRQPATPPAVTPAIGEFSIYSHKDCYVLPRHEFLKKCPTRATLDHFIVTAKTASYNVFRMASAPDVYDICRVLYENRDHFVFKHVVKEARDDVQELLRGGIYTFSTITSYPSGGLPSGDVISHCGRDHSNDIYIGPDGLIDFPATKAEAYVQAVLDTKDSMNKVDDVFRWIIGGTGTQILRLNHRLVTVRTDCIIMARMNDLPNSFLNIASVPGDKPMKALLVRYT